MLCRYLSAKRRLCGLSEVIHLKILEKYPSWKGFEIEEEEGEVAWKVPREQVGEGAGGGRGSGTGEEVLIRTTWDPDWRGRFLEVKYAGRKERHLLMNDESKAWDTDYLGGVGEILEGILSRVLKTALELRKKWRLFGTLTGTWRSACSQSKLRVLPLQLSLEELDFARSQGLIDVNSSSALTPETERRVRVFKDLQSRGFGVSSGTKYGGDFVIYAGDAMVEHASAVVHIIDHA
ncbi:hypothetical protein NDN08_001303 [Rhodosorus marinus]|uniref:tRNA-intron lyase n=1 Tax=Rhodosorus marinus TaxID=101924 RepID=A0AAV8UQK9_9RHOD|nr:hypothetical protein NDN08_001303 [Rhodosorus marinus]